MFGIVCTSREWTPGRDGGGQKESSYVLVLLIHRKWLGITWVSWVINYHWQSCIYNLFNALSQRESCSKTMDGNFPSSEVHPFPFLNCWSKFFAHLRLRWSIVWLVLIFFRDFTCLRLLRTCSSRIIMFNCFEFSSVNRLMSRSFWLMVRQCWAGLSDFTWLMSYSQQLFNSLFIYSFSYVVLFVRRLLSSGTLVTKEVFTAQLGLGGKVEV